MADATPSLAAHTAHSDANGGHGSDVTYLGEGDDLVMLMICSSCHWIIAECLHKNMLWNEEGTELICQLCGIDGT